MLDTTRHRQVFSPLDHNLPVHIIGAGATGSRVALELAGLGCDDISVYDFDVVEPHNLPNQAYLSEHIGMPKVEALQDLIQRKLGFIKPGHQFFNKKVERGEHPLAFPGVVFLLTDSFASRKEIFDNKIANSDTLWMIETRMASTHGHVFTVNPNNPISVEAWRETLGDDEDTDNIEQSACGTSISVGPTAAVIANLAVWQFIHLATQNGGRDEKLNIYMQPFMAATEAWA